LTWEKNRRILKECHPQMWGAEFNLAGRQAIEKGLTRGTGAVWLSLTTVKGGVKLYQWGGVKIGQ
jgi:uncharacterized lipoprotein YmbA